MNIKGDGEGVN